MYSTTLHQAMADSPPALKAKLSLIVVAVMVAVMVPFGWFTSRDLEQSAREEAVGQLNATNQMLRGMVAANQDGLKIALLRLGTVFRQHYQGSFALDEKDLVTVGGHRVPTLRLNGRSLALDNGIINQFNRETGGSVATVFVRAGDDFLRISTSLTKEDGTPAVGTFLGKDHPGYRKVLAGESFQGQARLFGREYMTEYIPVRDASRRVVGILFVGMDLTESLDSLLKKIGQLTVGKTGYAFVVNARAGEGYGQFLLHPAKEGKNALGEEGQAGIIRDMLARREGVLFYRWQNSELGDKAPREKVAAFSEYRELGWIICTSGYIDDFVKLSHHGRDRMILAVVVVSLLAIIVLNIAVGRWVMTPMLRLQSELRSAGRTLHTLINAMPDFVCFKDGEGRWLEANDVALKLFQVAVPGYRGKMDSELGTDPGGRREALLGCQSSVEEAWRTGGITRKEAGVEQLDGSMRFFEVVTVPLFHDHGRRNGLLIVGRDITDRRQAEAHQRLAARVFDTTGEAIMVTDTEANIVMVNPAFCRITGYDEAEVLGKTPSFLGSGHHDSAFHRAMWQTLQAQGTWAGEVLNRRKNGDVFPEWQTISSVRDDAGNVTHYVAVFADLSEIRRIQDAADRLARHDSLTGLPNRAFFIEQLALSLGEAHKKGGHAALLILGLDRFKNINEARGLAAGDGLLKAVALQLGEVLQSGDLLARLDSDEFAVLLPPLGATQAAAGRDALAVAEKLRMALEENVELDGEAIRLGASIGIALFPDSPGEMASDILRQADMALHQAKVEGGSRAVFFETSMGDAIKVRYDLERELHRAIDESQFRLYLQSQVDESGCPVGAEALIRWQHPERGLIPPATFIPLAESSDLIVSIDRWMLSEVCRLLARLDSEGRSFRVSVNVSPRHFSRPDFVDEVKRQLEATGADPTHLVLEVTEGLVIGDVADVVAKMATLTALGVHFSMDDFGTGYSSLSYLKRLPIHELKIDKSFIDDVPGNPSDVALVETILAVAQHLHLQVVAEGVETLAQADFLTARGQITRQGYLYGRPEPVDKWLMSLGERSSQRLTV